MPGSSGGSRLLSGCRDSGRNRACGIAIASLRVFLNPSTRRQFQTIVDRHDGDAYDKSFKSWDHLVALIFAQLSHVDGFRRLETVLTPTRTIITISACGTLARSTLSDANARRPVGDVCRTFAMAVAIGRSGATARGRSDVAPDRRHADPAQEMCNWANWNGRIRGLKMHVVYDPEADRPASRRDHGRPTSTMSRSAGQSDRGAAPPTFSTRPIATYGWWTKIHEAGRGLRHPPEEDQRAFAVVAGARCARPRAMASRSSTTPRSCLSARAIPSCRSRCAAFASSATTAA